MRNLYEEFMKNSLNFSRPSRARTLERFLDLLVIVLTGLLFLLALSGCHKSVNPSLEDRVFFPQNLRCEQGKIMLGTVGELPNDFLIVGAGRFAQDQKLLDICEEKLLIEKKKK